MSQGHFPQLTQFMGTAQTAMVSAGALVNPENQLSLMTILFISVSELWDKEPRLLCTEGTVMGL